MRIRLREAEQEDILKMADLFRDTVKTVNAADYTTEETADWAACGEEKEHWETLLERLHFVVAEVVNGRSNRSVQEARTDGGEMVGFASISDEGYLHSMFVHKNFQRCGVATVLLHSMEEYAASLGIPEITSEVSITARPFFENEGYRVVCRQKRRAKHLELENFVMKKVRG